MRRHGSSDQSAALPSSTAKILTGHSSPRACVAMPLPNARFFSLVQLRARVDRLPRDTRPRCRTRNRHAAIARGPCAKSSASLVTSSKCGARTRLREFIGLLGAVATQRGRAIRKSAADRRAYALAEGSTCSGHYDREASRARLDGWTTS